MKRKRKIICFTALVCLCVSCEESTERKEPLDTAPQQKKTKIELMNNDPAYNFGVVINDPKNIKGKEWLFVNKGCDSLYIDSVKVSCECLTLHYDNTNAIAPNHYFPIRVLLRPEEKEIGPFFREIMVFGNFEDSPYILTIEGEYKNDGQK